MQDNNYWQAVHGTAGVITVWIAVDDADEQNGAMKLLPRTHRPYVDMESHVAPRGSIVGREVDVAPDLEATAVTIAVPAGSVSIHDSYLLHGSGFNRSGRRRAAYTIRYLNPNTGFCDTGRHPVPAYLVRGQSGPWGDSYVDARPGTVLREWTDEEYRKYASGEGRTPEGPAPTAEQIKYMLAEMPKLTPGAAVVADTDAAKSTALPTGAKL